MKKQQYTTDQHYIPRFVLRNFATEKLLQVADISGATIRYFQTTPEHICFQKDLYEIKNEDGTYFDRNAIEDRFAFMEGWLAAQVRDLLLRNDNSSRLSGEQDAMLALLLAVQLVRLPDVKQIVYDKGTVGIIEKNYIYHALVNSHAKAIEYLRNNNVIIPAEIQSSKDKTLIDVVASYLLNDYFFYLIDASGIDEKFIIADQPVLIRPFEDAQYIYPISPDFAVACCSFTSVRGGQVESFVEAGEEMVHKINALSYKQSERFVIAKVFTQKHQGILEGKDDK